LVQREAKGSGKAAAKTRLAKGKNQLLHAEAGREAREAQGFAEEAKILAEEL
jgi:hypothetical protein